MLKPLLLTASVAFSLLANSAFGHAKLVDSFPASGARITKAPTTLTLSFNESVKLPSLILTRTGITIPLTVDTTAAAKRVVVPLPALAPGLYELRWTALSADDGHVTKGSLAFTVLVTTPAS